MAFLVRWSVVVLLVCLGCDQELGPPADDVNRRPSADEPVPERPRVVVHPERTPIEPKTAAPLPPLAWFVTEPVDDARVAELPETQGALERALLHDLARAKGRIRGALYSLNREPIVRALVSASARGVTVELAVECEQRFGADRATFARLEENGILVVDDRSSFRGLDPDCPESGGALHDKFLVIDEKLVWTGSANLTFTDLNYNHNHALRVESATVAATYLAEFELFWAGSFGTHKPPSAPIAHEVGGALVTVAFSPARSTSAPERSVSRDLLLAAVEDAASSIRFAAFTLTDEAVKDALVAFSPLVIGVLDATSARHPSGLGQELCASGVDLVVENFPGKVHHKLVLVDAENASGARVVGGSANFTRGGFDVNDENVFVVRGADFLASARRDFDDLRGDPAHAGPACCFHSAESWNGSSAMCGDLPCVCQDGFDNDHDGKEDGIDPDCAEPFRCAE